MRALAVVVVLVGIARADDCPDRTNCKPAERDETGCCPIRRRVRGNDPLPKPPAPKPQKPEDPAITAGRREAEALEAAARTANDPTKFAACAEKYLALYNKDPSSDRGDELLFNAASCYRDAKSIGAAIQMTNTLLRSFPQSPLAPRSLARLAALYSSVSFYNQAADKLEEYATKYSTAKDAADAMQDAIFYRKGIGDAAKAIADTQTYVKLWGGKQPGEAARAYFSIAAIYEQRHEDDKLVKHLTEFIQKFGAKDGADRLVLANAKIGLAKLRSTCPTPPVDGLCVALTRDRAGLVNGKLAGRTIGRCGGAFAYKTNARTTTRDALGFLRTAEQTYEKTKGAIRGRDAADERWRFEQARASYALAKLAEADLDLESYLGIAPPESPDFERDDAASRTRNFDRLSAWTATRGKALDALGAKYEAIVAIDDPDATIAAKARLGQLSQSYADSLLGVPFSAEVKPGTPAGTRSTQYCEKVTALVAPQKQRAIEAYDACLAASVKLGIRDRWTKLCEAQRGQLDPATFPTTSELTAHVAITQPVDLEPPVTTPDLAQLVAEFRATEGKWNAQSCDRVAKRFAALATADAKYMAGLAYHRCNPASAEPLYLAALKLAPDHAAARSNLGAIAYAAGRTADAKRDWDAAIKTNGKLVAARNNLALIELIELRKLSPRADTWKRLEEEARFNLSNALAVDSDHAVTYALYGALYLEGVESNHNRFDLAKLLIDEAVARSDKNAAIFAVLGAYYERRQLTPSAIDAYQQAAALDPSGQGALALGILLVDVRRYADAVKHLTAAKARFPQSYELQLALGIALRGTGKLAEAEAAYRRAIAIDGNRGETFYNLGILYKDHIGALATDRTKAVEAFTKAREHFAAAIPLLSAEPARDAKDAVADCDRALKSLTP